MNDFVLSKMSDTEAKKKPPIRTVGLLVAGAGAVVLGAALIVGVSKDEMDALVWGLIGIGAILLVVGILMAFFGHAHSKTLDKREKQDKEKKALDAHNARYQNGQDSYQDPSTPPSARRSPAPGQAPWEEPTFETTTTSTKASGFDPRRASFAPVQSQQPNSYIPSQLQTPHPKQLSAMGQPSQY